MERFLMGAGALLMFIGVGAGAFGAHALAGYFANYPNLKETYETAVRYHLIHAVALIALASVTVQWPSALINWAGYAIFVGILIFSGSLYLLVFTRVRWLGAITPLGGLAFLVGWFLIVVAAWRIHS